MTVRCLMCDLVQPNPTPVRHPSNFIWDEYRVTVCARCGSVWAVYA